MDTFNSSYDVIMEYIEYVPNITNITDYMYEEVNYYINNDTQTNETYEDNPMFIILNVVARILNW